jgi:hypothetical protein
VPVAAAAAAGTTLGVRDGGVTRSPEENLVVVACMRCAIDICPAGEMAWSSSLIKSQLGFGFMQSGSSG